MERRQFMGRLSAGLAGVGLAACGGGGAAGDSAAGSAAADSTAAGSGVTVASTKPTFVFVHGAWHGAWCWSEVVQLLAQQGYPAIALDLPGHGITAKLPAAYVRQPQDVAALSTEVSPLAGLTLADYRDEVLRAIRGLTAAGSGPIVLVGHSLGGATLSLVGETAPELIRRLVYLTAFVPVRFDTVLGYLTQPEFDTSEVPPLFVADPTRVACLRINHNSASASYQAQDRSAFYGDASDASFHAVANLLTPDEPIQAFTTKVVPTAARWGSVPRAFIRCTQDRAIPIVVQDQMIAEADKFTPGNKFAQATLTTSHSPFVSSPQALVDALTSFA